MIKTDLDRATAILASATIDQVSLITAIFLEQITDSLARQELVFLPGFGSFRLSFGQGGILVGSPLRGRTVIVRFRKGIRLKRAILATLPPDFSKGTKPCPKKSKRSTPSMKAKTKAPSRKQPVKAARSAGRPARGAAKR